MEILIIVINDDESNFVDFASRYDNTYAVETGSSSGVPISVQTPIYEKQ